MRYNDCFDDCCCEDWRDNNEQYVQCHLKHANLEQTAWIPSQFAVVGKVLKILYDDIWEDGWVVAVTYGTKTGRELDQTGINLL